MTPSPVRALLRAYRRTGADLPGGDPRPTHNALMEGWFWRFTDASRGRVVLALCGINRHDAGDWATVAVAAHPSHVVHSAAVGNAWASPERFEVRAGDVLTAGADHLSVDLDGVRLDVELREVAGWPLRLGAGGIFSSLPALGQYWHPHILGGTAYGTLDIAGERLDLTGAQIYAEKNWGAGFPDWWWWGQAQGFADPELCVAFGGGRLTAGPAAINITGAVLRTAAGVVRFAPPAARVTCDVGAGRWTVVGKKHGWRMQIDGDGTASRAAVLPVPLPAERRNVDRDFEHLAARMRVRVWRRGMLVLEDESAYAALEVGALDPQRAAELGRQAGAIIAA